jgi:adenylate cyclase
MRYRALGIVVLATVVISGILVVLGLFRGIESTLSDRLFAPQAPDTRILIVGIDDASLAALGQWPLPRATIAEGLARIIEGEPAAVGVDIIFAEPSRIGIEDDVALSQLLSMSSVPIVLPVEGLTLALKENAPPYAESILRTLPLFTGPQVRFGHINLIKDRDGIVRRFPPAIEHEGISLPSFTDQITGISRTGAAERIVWSGRPGTVPHISFNEILGPDFDTRLFKDAYVFLGATAANLHDTQTTPVSEGTPMAGVEIQAQIANMLLSGMTLAPLSVPYLGVWILVLAVLVGLAFFRLRNVSLAVITTVAIGIMNLVAIGMFFEYGIAVDIVYTTLALFIAGLLSFLVRYFFLERERREIRGVFSKYVSGAVLEELLKDPAAVKLGGVETDVTVFFSDIRGFTSFSERLTPSELTSLLNRYLTRMTDIILADGGVVDKYIGDAIMAFWGAPLKDAAHPYRAIQSSLAMLDALDVFNAELNDPNMPKVNIGIGLNTGRVIVGNMGSEQRFDYTIMGDTVNLGSRIEGQTKTYGIRLLASEMTIRAFEQTGITDPEICIREIDKVTVKGKKEPVALFEIIERSRQEFVLSILSDFELLRTHYYAGDWHSAVSVGARILSIGEDGPTKVLYERALAFHREPPESWRGVYELTSK